MEEIMITVPYGDFLDGVKALADLESIQAIITGGGGYCSEDIKLMLGIPVKNNNTVCNEGV